VLDGYHSHVKVYVTTDKTKIGGSSTSGCASEKQVQEVKDHEGSAQAVATLGA
jgi:hypothetical protein